ncbi:hypothetical protein V8G54_031674, partial [Vigna mungo]
MICAALHLDEGAILEHGVHEFGMTDDGHVHGEADEADPCFETASYNDVGGCLEEEKKDVEDVMDDAPLLGIHPRLHSHDDVRFMNVNSKYLYSLVIPVVFEICDQTFGTEECFFLGPRKQVGNMVIMKF